MEPYFAMGLFALYVVAISLFRVLSEKEFPRLTAMKKIWGRRQGLALHFLSNVAIPLVLGIIFLCRGVTAFDSDRTVSLIAPAHHLHTLSHLYSRTPLPPAVITPAEVAQSGEISLLLASDHE